MGGRGSLGVLASRRPLASHESTAEWSATEEATVATLATLAVRVSLRRATVAVRFATREVSASTEASDVCDVSEQGTAKAPVAKAKDPDSNET